MSDSLESSIFPLTCFYYNNISVFYSQLWFQKVVKLAPIVKNSASSTGKSGAGQLGKSSGKSSYGSNISKTGSFGSTISKTSSLGSTSKSVSSSGKTASFFPVSTGGFTPSTSKKSYETVSYSPKTGKPSTSLGIIWIPTKKKNKKKDVVYSAMNNDKKNDRSPSMYSYNFMSGDSPDFQLHKKKDEEANLLIPDRLKGPIATAASAGAVATIVESPAENADETEDKLLKRDSEDNKEAAGDTNKDNDYLENKENSVNIPDGKQKKSTDKVDSAFLPSTGSIKPPPPRSTESNPEEEDCGIKCLYYTLQCCDCVLM